MVIIIWQPGGIGNCLMLWSHFIAYGIENKKCISNPRFVHFVDDFPKLKRNFLLKYPNAIISIPLCKLNYPIFKCIPLVIKLSSVFKLKFIKLVKLNDVYNDKFSLENIKNINTLNLGLNFVMGWQFRAPNLVKKHKHKIIDFFRVDKAKYNLIESTFKLFKDSYRIILGVHIRRGDYKYFHGGKFFYYNDIYINQIKRFLTFFSNEKILIFISTDNLIAKEDFQDFNVFINNGTAIEDLYSLSKCNYIIGPPSSFSIWASFYGNVPLYHIEDPDYCFSLEDFSVNNTLTYNY